MHLQLATASLAALSLYVCVCCHIFQVSNEQIAYHVPVSIPKVYLHVLVGVLKIAEMPPPAWILLPICTARKPSWNLWKLSP